MRKEILILLALVCLGVLSRTIFHLGPNIEFVTGITILGMWTFKSNWLKFTLPLMVMVLSDIIIGNTIIYVFTWSGFLLVALIGFAGSKLRKDYSVFIGSGIAGVLVFFLWTNLGVVLTTGMYEHSFAGLVQSYVNALPFLRVQLLTNAIILNCLWLALYAWQRLTLPKLAAKV